MYQSVHRDGNLWMCWIQILNIHMLRWTDTQPRSHGRPLTRVVQDEVWVLIQHVTVTPPPSSVVRHVNSSAAMAKQLLYVRCCRFRCRKSQDCRLKVKTKRNNKRADLASTATAFFSCLVVFAGGLLVKEKSRETTAAVNIQNTRASALQCCKL